MTGLDTNIVLRYILQDDPVQARTVTWLIERDLTEQNPGFISIVTMVETVWTLVRSYDFSKQEVASILERLLQIESLVVQNEPEVFYALVAFKRGQGSFADALVAALGAWAGCDFTLTFDKKASRLEKMKLF
jgi:predicted nucleic-acid-binding protein